MIGCFIEYFLFSSVVVTELEGQRVAFFTLKCRYRPQLRIVNTYCFFRMSNEWSNDWGDSSQTTQRHGYQQQPPQFQAYGGYSEPATGYYQPSQGQPVAPQQNYGDYYGQQQSSNIGYGFPSSPQDFMSDPMMKAAQHFGGQFAEQQKEKISKYLNTFNLKYYFSVDNSYVGKKLGILLFPFFHRDWSLKYAGSDEPVPAKDDVNAPDLYIPLMAFITYVIVSGFVLGTQGR
ncbi:Hrf1 family protein [Ostertagia ostertagi]